MWNEIKDDGALREFMLAVGGFHDGCVKEIKYVSGAYVDADLHMRPLNSSRTLNVIIQRQSSEYPLIELEFGGLKRLDLCPLDEEWTCEISCASMLFKDGYVYWCDCEGFDPTEERNGGNTVICAKTLRWRSIGSRMGDGDFYRAAE